MSPNPALKIMRAEFILEISSFKNFEGANKLLIIKLFTIL